MRNYEIPWPAIRRTARRNGCECIALNMMRAAILCRLQVARIRIVPASPEGFADTARALECNEDFQGSIPGDSTP